MSKELKTNRTLGGRFLFPLLLNCTLAVAANGQTPKPATNEQPKVSQTVVVTKALATSFGPALEVTGFKPPEERTFGRVVLKFDSFKIR